MREKNTISEEAEVVGSRQLDGSARATPHGRRSPSPPRRTREVFPLETGERERNDRMAGYIYTCVVKFVEH